MTRYRLSREEPLSDGVYRIVSELADEATRHLEFERGAVDGIHEARKACKKARGLARLVRPSLSQYREVNHHFRDAARQLAPVRDPQAFLEMFDKLSATPAASDEIKPLHGYFSAGARHAMERFEAEEDRVESARKLIRAGRLEADEWQMADRFESIAGGVERTYRRGRDAIGDVGESGGVADLHEWRKGVKYLWYQTRLLQDTAPSVLGPLARRLRDVSDALGDAHDLALMVETVATADTRDSSKEAFRVLATGYRSELEQRALGLGRRLYVEEPPAFVARLAAYWEIWETGDEPEAGELTKISG